MFARTLLLGSVLLAGLFDMNLARAAGPANFMLATQVDGKELLGQPLIWNHRDMCLLGRDGAYHIFPNKSAKNSKKINRSFYPYTSSEMKQLLRKEFGHSFEVSSTEHFVVVHPKGSREWADRMETLYRTFITSMRVRGITVKKPQVTMVAIIFRNRDQYFNYFKAKNQPMPSTTLGHYEENSNRVYLFNDGGTEKSMSTVIHEATHQTAYNVGVHQRRAPQPAWLVEGLAMMFETPGMREAWSIQSRGSRINQYRLDYFREYLERRPKDALIRLIASDQPFDRAALDAYAESWVLSFYLFETRSHDYSRYLARVAARSPFSSYSARARVADFMSAFGDDLQVLESQMLRFVEEL